jgi:hypothetical protein
MLHVTAMPLPGVLRLRALHPLIEGDGSCSLIYDLERAAVVEVPEELQFHVAPALETGDLDEALVGWLIAEDLLTGERGMGWPEAAAAPAEAVAWWSPGDVYQVDSELHVRIGQEREDTALEVLASVLHPGSGNGRVRLHIDWRGAFPGNDVLARIAVESCRLAGPLGQEVSFELTLAAAEVTPARADFLAGYAFQVRLLCGSYPAPLPCFYADRSERGEWEPEAAVRLLLDRLGDRLMVHCVLDRGRLLDLWEWAKQTGIRHLDATLLDDSVVGDGLRDPARTREIRNDLLAVCEEMGEELAAQHLPVDYKPLTRIVDRLMRSEPPHFSYGDHGPGLMPLVDGFPRSFLDSFDLRLADFPGRERLRGGLEPEAGELPCQGCWARHVCSHSAYVASVQDGDERELSEADCSRWRLEVEAALRFYHSLAHMDPVQVRKFFADACREPGPMLGLRDDPEHSRMPF